MASVLFAIESISALLISTLGTYAVLVQGNAAQRAAIDFIAVSYTHLDVYKRQDFTLASGQMMLWICRAVL